MPRKMTTATKQSRQTAKTNRVSAFHRRLTVGFLAVSILLILVILYFSLSQVKIYITPKVSDLKTTFKIELLTDAGEVLAGTNILPGTISTTTKIIKKTFPVPAGGMVEDTARGQVTIINNYSKNQPLIKTTRLLAPDGKLFRLNETVNVPAGGRVKANVYADKPGPDYDIEPTKFTIPGLWEGLQKQIYAESLSKFSGGLRSEKTITQDLLDQTADSFIKQAREQIRTEIQPSENNLITYAMGGSTWSANAEPGQISTEFTISVTTPITIIEFKKEDLQNIALNNLIAKTPLENQFVSANFDSLQFELTDINDNNKSASLNASLQGKSAARIDKNDLDISQLTGKTKQELAAYLKSLPEIEDIKVTFIPAWLNKVPPLRDHIYIEIVK